MFYILKNYWIYTKKTEEITSRSWNWTQPINQKLTQSLSNSALCLPHGLSPSWLSGFPGGSDSKEAACNAGDLRSIPGSGRCPGEGNGNPLQDSCLENSMDGEAWRAAVHGVAKNRTWLSDSFTLAFDFYPQVYIIKYYGLPRSAFDFSLNEINKIFALSLKIILDKSTHSCDAYASLNIIFL